MSPEGVVVPVSPSILISVSGSIVPDADTVTVIVLIAPMLAVLCAIILCNRPTIFKGAESPTAFRTRLGEISKSPPTALTVMLGDS